jgi:ssDNA-binding Zn-finger/Zn-ribbon topoisomerase 1
MGFREDDAQELGYKCHHCGHGRFLVKEGMINTARMSFWNLDFLDPVASVHICTKCGYLHWFMSPPVGEPDDDVPCPNCQAIMLPDESVCPTCGWSYEAAEEESKGSP